MRSIFHTPFPADRPAIAIFAASSWWCGPCPWILELGHLDNTSSDRITPRSETNGGGHSWSNRSDIWNSCMDSWQFGPSGDERRENGPGRKGHDQGRHGNG